MFRRKFRLRKANLEKKKEKRKELNFFSEPKTSPTNFETRSDAKAFRFGHEKFCNEIVM